MDAAEPQHPRGNRTMRNIIATGITLIGIGAAHGQVVNHCRPDGAGGFVCGLERLPPPGPPPMTDADASSFRGIIRSQIPDVPYLMTPDEMTAQLRSGSAELGRTRSVPHSPAVSLLNVKADSIGWAIPT
jgi:hypothetical protein